MSLRALLLACLLALLACREADPTPPERVPVHVRVALDASNSPVVVLEEDDGPRLLHIWIGMTEARSIAEEIEKRPRIRPNTHDLAERVIHGLEGELIEVVVNDLRQGIYYATMALRLHGRLVEIDARPSDAIAIAIRVDAPIFVLPVLFEEDEDDLPSGGAGQEIHWLPDAQGAGSEPATPATSL